jgi:phosphatidylserine decarboxylase
VEIKERAPEENWKSEKGVSFLKGEELGWFEMGSTIVLIFEGPKNTKLNV